MSTTEGNTGTRISMILCRSGSSKGGGSASGGGDNGGGGSQSPYSLLSPIVLIHFYLPKNRKTFKNS